MKVLTKPQIDLTAQCILVPTMGALHGGHGSLIEAAVRRARIEGVPSVVSIFVNPKQFNEQADFDQYPNRMDDDLHLCEQAGVDVVFNPSIDTVYPPGEDVVSNVIVPDIARLPGLEDKYRPGHFDGVCQVVSRLFDLCDPSASVFGEKDWQQLACIRAMNTQQNRKLVVIPAETVREESGLAMSSRNLNLSQAGREQATAISQALFASSQENTPRKAELCMQDILQEANIEPEYAVVRDAKSLMQLGQHDRDQVVPPCRALIAAYVDGVRLIDNAPWTPRAYDSTENN